MVKITVTFPAFPVRICFDVSLRNAEENLTNHLTSQGPPLKKRDSPGWTTG